MLAAIACPAIMVLAVTAAPSQPDACFPPEAKLDQFRQAWYCKQLAAAREGRLGGVQSYRFTYLPSFDPGRIAVVYGIGHRWLIVGKVLTGRGGYDPGSLVRVTQRWLTDEEARLLLQRLDNAGVWSSDTNKESRGDDGAEWIVEARAPGRYALQVEWSPDKTNPSPYRTLCVHMLELAAVQPTGDERPLY